MVEQDRHMNVLKVKKSRHVFHLVHKPDSNNNNSNNSSSSSYSPELPKIEEEFRELCIDKVLDGYRGSMQVVGSIHDDDSDAALCKFDETSHSSFQDNHSGQVMDKLETSLNQFDQSDSPHFHNTIDEISTSSQFSSLSEESLKESLIKSPLASFENKLNRTSNDRSLKTPKKRYSENVKRQLFISPSPIRFARCHVKHSTPNQDISKQFKQNMRKLKEASRDCKEPVTCLQDTLQYQMSKPTMQLSRKELKFGGKRNKRFQTCASKVENDSDNIHKKSDCINYQCTSCGMRFRYLCNLSSHFVIVHNTLREDDFSFQQSVAKAQRQPTTQRNTDCCSGIDGLLNVERLTVGASSTCYQQLLYGKKKTLHFCEICEKFFKFAVNLQTHKKTVHST